MSRGGTTACVNQMLPGQVPLYIADVRPPSPGLNRYAPVTPNARAPLLPSLFLPGFPKCATTWLFGCLLASFAPARVGCGTAAANWTSVACRGRRFLLTALRSDPLGQLSPTKETFYFGGNLGASLFEESLLSLHGPDPRPPSLSEMPALWPWESAAAGSPATERPPPGVRGSREREAWRRMARAPRLRLATGRMRALCPAPDGVAAQACHRGEQDPAERRACQKARRCSGRGVGGLATSTLAGVGGNSCSHPACERIARAHPTDSRPFSCK